MDTGAWLASPSGHRESDMTEQLSTQNILLRTYRYHLAGNAIYFILSQISKVSESIF